MVSIGSLKRALLPCFVLLACGEHRLVVGFGPPREVGLGGTAGVLSEATSGDGGDRPLSGSGGQPPSLIGGAGEPGEGGRLGIAGVTGGVGSPGAGAGLGGSGGMRVVASCGNGLLEDSEQCDDGNASPDDGCDPSCVREADFDCSGQPEVPCNRSCVGMAGTECAGGHCCSSPPVEGGTFEQWGELSDQPYQSTVSSFRLDQFEVTVARFRAFLAARPAWKAAGNPKLGAGANPNIDGTGWAGWGTSAFRENEPPTCSGGPMPGGTLADTGNDTLPMNCASWYYAFEFCVWDGGRLPTQAEWEFAATGGALQRRYPWGNEPLLTEKQDETAAYAVYGSLGDGSAWGESSFEDILAVGSRPLGAGGFGHEDLAGSMREWVYDARPNMEPTMPVTDFAFVSPGAVAAGTQGGGWSSPAAALENANQGTTERTAELTDLGIRCARQP